MSLSGFIVANYVTANLAYEYKNKQDKKDLAEDIKLITSKARGLKSKIGERERFVCDSGVWFLTKGEDSLVYALCVSQDYPERLAFGFIKKVEALIK